MAGPPLSQQEFERWCETDQFFKERVLDHIDAQNDRNIATEGRVSSLETQTGKNAKVSWVSIVIAVIGGIATVLSAMLGGHSKPTKPTSASTVQLPAK